MEPVNHSKNGTRGSRTTLSLISLYHTFEKNARMTLKDTKQYSALIQV